MKVLWKCTTGYMMLFFHDDDDVVVVAWGHALSSSHGPYTSASTSVVCKQAT